LFLAFHFSKNKNTIFDELKKQIASNSTYLMDSFRTQLSLVASKQSISHQDCLLSIGSCFAESMGARLAESKFKVVLNPFGILFNPVSIALSIQHLLADKQYQAEELHCHCDLWHSLDHHSRFSTTSAENTLEKINSALQTGQEQLANATFLLVTLGSAHVWTYLPQNRIVANCHKLPAKDFSRRRLSVEETVEALYPVFAALGQQNPNLQIILTVSPVRYLRDGFVENQLSKATLLLACEQLRQRLPQVQYFPAYELLMDDLRDYRFYGEDLVHPSNTAVNYIWKNFGQVFFTPATQQLLTEITAIGQAAKHRPFQPASAAHQQFIQRQLALINQLEARHPGLQLTEERAVFNATLHL
jgi:hypothetical protein